MPRPCLRYIREKENNIKIGKKHGDSMTNLFQLKTFKSASGKMLPWKIECDGLTYDDWECLAFMIAERCGNFSSVYGCPTGGEPLARALEKYKKEKGPRLLVDDVYTTGGTIKKYRQKGDKIWVVFARRRPPKTHKIKVLFQMDESQ